MMATTKQFSECTHDLMMKTTEGAWISVVNYTLSELEAFGLSNNTECTIHPRNKMYISKFDVFRYGDLANMNHNREISDYVWTLTQDGKNLVITQPN